MILCDRPDYVDGDAGDDGENGDDGDDGDDYDAHGISNVTRGDYRRHGAQGDFPLPPPLSSPEVISNESF